MDDLLERYLSAVCSYFLGKKRKHVYNDLKNNIMDISSQYDDMETQLVDYGHPLSVAYIDQLFFIDLIKRMLKR